MKTYIAKPSNIKRDWFVIDASGRTLGRLATEIARRLRGKHKPEFTRNIDAGDYIVVVNAEKVRVTGRKYTDKVYHRHTGYPGGIKTTTFEKMQQKQPARIIEKAVKGMLPKGPMGRQLFRKLKVYAGADHRHAAQQPQTLEI
jgi:large subunit ribosomal protein L13